MQKKDKREAILQAALALIAEHGFQHTPMSLIAKQSGASAGIIYHYFESKDELIEALYRRVKTELSQAIFAADEPDLPHQERFPLIWMNLLHYCIEHPQETAFLEQYESLPEWQYHTEATFDEEAALFQLVYDLQAQGVLKDLPFVVLSEFITGIVFKLARQISAGSLSLDDTTLFNIAKACWDAVAR